MRWLKRSKTSLTGVISLAGIVLHAACSQGAPETTFAGKTITVSTHSAAGGTYDLYARLFARHFGKYLPGNPAVVVYNQIGAGGLVSTNHVGLVAPKDGTSLILMSMGLPALQVAGLPGLRLSVRDFQWIGNLSRSNNVMATWAESGIASLDDAKKRDVVLGVTGSGSIASGFPIVLNSLLGTRFKVIPGYTSGAHMKLAMERREIDGRGLDTWAGWKTLAGPEIKAGKLNTLVQVGTERDDELPNVPLLMEALKGTPEKDSVARFLTFGMTAGRPFAAPPGTPPEIVALLRSAFDRMVAAPDFQADASKVGAEVSTHSGQQVTDIMTEIYTAPRKTVELVRSAMFQTPQK